MITCSAIFQRDTKFYLIWQGSKNLRIFFASDSKHTHRSFIDPEYTVIDQQIIPWDVNLELHNGGASWGNQGGLHVFISDSVQRTFQIHLVKDFANDMKRRGTVRANIAEIDS